MGRVWVRRVLAAGLSVVVCAGLVAETVGQASATGAKPNPKGSDAYTAGTPYAGDFPDPSIMRLGDAYFGFSTTISNKNLPLITSKDLTIWQPRAPYSASPTDNDALPDAAIWSNWRTINGHRVAPTWAPSVARIAGRYVSAYATQLRDGSKFCISVARSASPFGPFVDPTTGPLVCPAHQGAIDPFLFRYRGRNWLLYKTDGASPKIWSRELNKYATGFKRHSVPKVLLKPALAWEGGVIENPAMVVYGKRLYLFYSANNWANDRYRIGYAVCTSIQAKCKRLTRYPLMGNTTTIAGPGGESPFLDANGNLRMAYHAWQPGNIGYPSTTKCLSQANGCPQRRMHIAQLLRVPGTKRLTVVNYGARFGA